MPSVDMTDGEFRGLFEAASTWDRWDDAAERGALDHLTPARTAAAARLVRTGATVTLSRLLKTVARIDVLAPAEHHTTLLTDVDIGSGSVRFAKDYVGVDYHNDGHTHIDAFSHVSYIHVLAINAMGIHLLDYVVILLVGGTLTLIVQRRLARSDRVGSLPVRGGDG